MKVFLVPNATHPAAIETAQAAAAILAECGAEVLVEADTQSQMGPGAPLAAVAPGAGYDLCDVVISVGGDGSMLHTARQLMPRQKPLLGINTGRLGFLTALEDNELDKLRLLVRGETVLDYRSTVQYDAIGAEGSGTALNDVVLFKQAPEKTIALDIYCDDILMSSFRGDGVVFATPTGSTAYSMSAGGPIVDARLAGIIVTQICAHIVHMPPMVLAGDRSVRVVSRGAQREVAHVIVDGVKAMEFRPGDTILIRQSGTRVPLIQFVDTDQLKSIDKKLKGR